MKTGQVRGRPPTTIKQEQLDMVASCMTAGISREQRGMSMRGDVGKNGSGSWMGHRVGGKGYMWVARSGKGHITQRREDGDRAAQVTRSSAIELNFGYVSSCLPPTIHSDKHSMLKEGESWVRWGWAMSGKT